jgi:hypothetical protein
MKDEPLVSNRLRAGKLTLASDNYDFNATPAIAGRQLFLRSNRTLYCIESVQTAGAGKTR